MTPITRGRRARVDAAGGNIEPLSPALESNALAPTRPSHSHVRFDQGEGITPIARGAGSGIGEITKELDDDEVTHVNGADSMRDEIPDSQEEEEEDNDAPEAVSMGTGKRDAEKREEDAKRIVEAQKEASKKKRKERDTKLKEQKAEAEERKRKRENKRRRLETVEDEQDAAIEDQLNREVMAVTEQAESVPISAEVTSKKSKPPLLLPESLLAQVSARPSPPAKHSAEGGEDEGEEMNVDPLVRTGNSARASARLEKNRRRREQKKRNKILKKGVVSVKVLRDERASRKSMAPPASKQVAHIKESWLHKHRKGGIERRSVGGGFIKQR